MHYAITFFLCFIISISVYNTVSIPVNDFSKTVKKCLFYRTKVTEKENIKHFRYYELNYKI